MEDATIMPNGEGELHHVRTDVFKLRAQSVIFGSADTRREVVDESVARNDFYNVSEAKKKVYKKEPSPVFGSEKKITFAEQQAKRNISPGPTKYDTSRAYKNISQIVSRRRS